MSPPSLLMPEKPLENRLLAGCHASCDYELCRDSDGFYTFIVIFLSGTGRAIRLDEFSENYIAIFL